MARLPRIELAAPDWIAQLVRLRPGAVPWLDIVRMAVALPTPLAVGVLAGQPAVGVITTMGALATSLADRGGPPRLRVAGQAGAGVAGAVGLLLGHLAAGTGWLSVLTVAVVALVSALLSVVNATTSTAALQLLVYLSISSGLSVPVPPYVLVLCYLSGALWAILLSTVGALIGGTRAPERDAVAGVYRAVAGLLDATGDEAMPAARQSLTTALNTAYDAVLSVRSRSAGRNPEFRKLAALLNAATPVVEASVAIAHSGRRPPGEVAATVRELATAIATGAAPPESPPPTTEYRLRALSTGIEEVREQLRPGHDPGATPLLPPSLHIRLVRLTSRVLTGPSTWLYAMRLVLCMSLAEVLRGVLPLDRSYWVLLTVAIVLKPDFGSVFARAVQRGAGTLVGVVIGVGLLALVPAGGYLLPFVALSAAVLPLARSRNFGMFAIFLTPLASMLVDFTTHGGPSLVVTRLLDTLAGCLLVLVFGYLLWPETWRVRVGPRVADSVDELSDYLGAAFGPTAAARAQRRRAYRTLSDLRTTFQQQLAEPPPVSTRAAAWWPLIVQLERATDAITAAALRFRAVEGGDPPPSASVDRLCAGLRDLSGALRERRRPVELPVPEDEELAGITTEVRTARALASGPG